MNRLLLIDGNAMMHRAYHAIPTLTDFEGRPVQVVYGFVSMLFKLYDTLHPTHISVAFDRPGPTFRNELFDGYQAKRPKADDSFIQQIPFVHDAVTACHIPAYEQDGFEADDVIGTIVSHVIPGLTRDQSSVSSVRFRPGGRNDKKGGIDQIIIVTGDRDILQLVEDDRVLVYMPTKGLSSGKLFREKDVMEQMGVTPKQIVDLKALMGDNSDNYLGVRGIGPKTAIRLLQMHHSLERIYKEIASGTLSADRGVIQKLTEGKEQAILGKKLAAIVTTVPITFDSSSSRIATLDTPELRSMLETLQFRSLLKRLNSAVIMAKEMYRTRSEKTEKKSEQQQLL